MTLEELSTDAANSAIAETREIESPEVDLCGVVVVNAQIRLSQWQEALSDDAAAGVLVAWLDTLRE